MKYTYTKNHWRIMVIITVLAILIFLGINFRDSRADGSYEYAMFPNGVIYVSQTAYSSYSHSGKNVTDIVPSGDIKAPFTGTIRYKDNTWGYVILESDNPVYYADGSLAKMCVGFMHDNNIDDLYVGKKISQGQAFYQKGTKSPRNNVTGAHVHIICMRGAYSSSLASQYSSRGNVYIYDAFYLAENTTITKSGYSSSVWKRLNTTQNSDSILSFNNIAYPNPYKINSSGYVWRDGSGSITAKDGLASVVFNIYDKNGNRVAHYENNQNVKILTMASITSKIKMSALTVEGTGSFEVIATDVNGRKLERTVLFTASNSKSTVNNTFSYTYSEPSLVSSVSWGDSIYYLYESSYSWLEAADFATAQGGYLATITSGEENAIVADLISAGGYNANLGGYFNGDSYVWKTSENMAYTNWNAGEPNRAGNVEKYMMMYGTKVTGKREIGEWNDATNSNGVNAFVVEISNGGILTEDIHISTPEGLDDADLFYAGYDDDSKRVVLNAYAMPEEARGAEISWTISNPKVLRLDSTEKLSDGSSNGYFTIIGVGETNITATTSDRSNANKSVKLGYYITSITMPNSNTNLEVGDTWQVNPIIVPNIATNTDLNWTSSNSQVASVDVNGVVTAHAGGTATITATPKTMRSGYEIQSSCTVTVASGPILAFNNIAYPNIYKISSSGYVWGSGSGTITARDGLDSVVFNIYDKNGNQVAHYVNNQNVTTLTMQSITSNIKMSALTVEGFATFEIVATDVHGNTLEGEAVFTASSTHATETWRLNRNYIEPIMIKTVEYGNSEYFLYKASYSWERAFSYAQSLGGHLAVITSNEENNCIADMLSSSNVARAWIGGHLIDQDYLWVTGESMVYTSWSSNEPNNAGNMEKWMAIGNTGLWYDAPNANNSYNWFVIEKSKIPTSGVCGENAVWTYNNHVLTVSGTGPMYDLRDDEIYLWDAIKSDACEIIIEDGITKIGDWNFTAWTNVNRITISSSVTSIGMMAFSNCHSLVNIYIPQGVTEIEEWAFGDDDSLVSIQVDSANPVYSSNDGILYNKDQTVLIQCPAAKTSATIPNTVQIITERAFRRCNNLTNIVLPDNVQSIGWDAFLDCQNLMSFIVPNKVTSIESYTFYNCFNLSSITIPESVTNIALNAFNGCSNLTIYCYDGSAAHIYASDLSIPYVIIGGTCGQNATWELSQGIITITGTGSVDNYNYADSSMSPPWADFKQSILEIVVTDGITGIGDDAFSGCINAASVHLPETLRSIGAYSFYNCNSLTAVDFPNNLSNIGNSAFLCCSSITQIELPDTVTFVGSAAFRSCISVISLKLSNGMTTIMYDCFDGCNSIPSVIIPESITKIGYRAFEDCHALTEIRIPASVTEIDVSTVSVEDENSAFKGDSDLRILCYAGSTAHLYARANGITYSLIDTVFPPADFVIPFSLRTIEEEAFSGITARYVKLSDETSSIGNKAFANCPNLVCIYIPEDCNSIAASAFESVNNLTIFGADGSFAQFYAGKRGFDFVEIDDE